MRKLLTFSQDFWFCPSTFLLNFSKFVHFTIQNKKIAYHLALLNMLSLYSIQHPPRCETWPLLQFTHILSFLEAFVYVVDFTEIEGRFICGFTNNFKLTLNISYYLVSPLPPPTSSSHTKRQSLIDSFLSHFSLAFQISPILFKILSLFLFEG